MNSSFFATTDLPLATFLKCNDIPLAEEYNMDTKEWFFQDPAACKKLSLDLANGESSVSVLQYEMHRKHLLSLAKRSRAR